MAFHIRRKEALKNKTVSNPDWKLTKNKQYEAYVCMPATGSDVVNILNGASQKTHSEAPFVISGVCGENYTIGLGYLLRDFVNADGSPITRESLTSKLTADKIIDWIKIKSVSQNCPMWAQLIPISNRSVPVMTVFGEMYANAYGPRHGAGDFLVCRDTYGEPNLRDVRLVNGIEFAKKYDMRAFPGILPADMETPVPQSILSHISNTKMETNKKEDSLEDIEAKRKFVYKRLLEICNEGADNVITEANYVIKAASACRGGNDYYDGSARILVKENSIECDIAGARGERIKDTFTLEKEQIKLMITKLKYHGILIS